MACTFYIRNCNLFHMRYFAASFLLSLFLLHLLTSSSICQQSVRDYRKSAVTASSINAIFDKRSVNGFLEVDGRLPWEADKPRLALDDVVEEESKIAIIGMVSLCVCVRSIFVILLYYHMFFRYLLPCFSFSSHTGYLILILISYFPALFCMQVP